MENKEKPKPILKLMHIYARVEVNIAKDFNHIIREKGYGTKSEWLRDKIRGEINGSE